MPSLPTTTTVVQSLGIGACCCFWLLPSCGQLPAARPQFDRPPACPSGSRQVVATGGWPANNAALISSHKACDGWLHIINGVLLPTAQIRQEALLCLPWLSAAAATAGWPAAAVVPSLASATAADARKLQSARPLRAPSLPMPFTAPTAKWPAWTGHCNQREGDLGPGMLPLCCRDLPRLVDGIPDISQTKFWGLLDGTGVGSGGAADAPAPAFEMSPAPPPTSHSNNTGVVVTDGNGTEVGSAAPGAAGGSSSGDSDRVLVVAASVAAGAVALCTVLVAFVLLRKRQLRRRRQQHRRLEGKEDDEDEAAFERSMSVSKHSTRPVTVHVDA